MSDRPAGLLVGQPLVRFQTGREPQYVGPKRRRQTSSVRVMFQTGREPQYVGPDLSQFFSIQKA